MAKGDRPEQAPLTADNDLSKTEETKRVVEAMIDALNDHDIAGMDRFFSPDFRWIGNAGCGVKHGLRAFQDGWQKPFQHAFSEKTAIDEARIVQGEWMASFGAQRAKHTGTFMGIPPSGQEVEIRYMDFWQVRDGKIVDNWVMIDFPHVMRQLGVDPFNGQGWDDFREDWQPPGKNSG